MKVRLLILLWLSLSLGSWAQSKLDPMVLVHFRVVPGHAEVFLEGSASNVVKGENRLSLGFADEGVLLERSKFPSGNIVVTFRAPGYRDLTQQFSVANALANFNEITLPASDLRALELPKVARDRLSLALGGGAVLIALGLAWGGYMRFRASRTKVFDIMAWVSQNVVDDSDGDPLVGQLLGRYWVLEKLGHGGMACVYRAAREDDLEAPIALKVIHAHVAEGKDFVGRFNREVALSSKLIHPGIITVEDAGCMGGRYFIALELVDGKDLRSYLPDGGFMLDEGLDKLEAVFQAVAYAHSLGIVHRDLKPENIMVTKDNRLKLTDFGLARSHDVSTLTATGSIMGTPGYMAPEQIAGASLNPATDQYALGVMAFELLTGHLPFEAEEIMQVIVAHLSAPIPCPSSLRPDLPIEVDAWIQKMMAKAPSDRFISVAEALEALHAIRHRKA